MRAGVLSRIGPIHPGTEEAEAAVIHVLAGVHLRDELDRWLAFVADRLESAVNKAADAKR